MSFPTNKSAKGFFRRFRDLVDELGACEELELSGSVRLGDSKVRFPGPLPPIQIQLGGEQGKLLHLHPEPLLEPDGTVRPSGAYLLYDPGDFFSGITGFLRLESGDSVILGREDGTQQDLLDYPKTVAERHLSIKLKSDGIVLKDLSSPHGTCISTLPPKSSPAQIVDWRMAKLERLAKIFGGPLEPLPKVEAWALIEAVIECIETGQHQAFDSNGNCGGVIVLPETVTPVFVGDLHTRIDNLLVILTQNGFLEGLESGSAALVILGDAVHPDEDGLEGSMDSSMLMMDLIFRLKLAFPDRVFYLRGNHDSFSEEISKGGVPQGVLWEQALRDVRGSKYLQAMSRLYEILPYVALSERFIACHAGAPTCKVSREMLVDIRSYPPLERDVTRLRLRRPNSPSGYNQGDVKRLRRRLGLAPETIFIVGHTPLSPDDTLWLNAGGISNHHVLFGANPDCVGAIVLAGERLLPVRYPAEPLTALYNRIVADK